MDIPSNGAGKIKYVYRICLMLAGLGLFVFIGYAVSTGDSKPFDYALRHGIYRMRSSVLDDILIPVTYMGNPMTIISVIVVLILIPATRKNIGLPTAITGVVVVVFYKILKTSFARPRPEEVYRLIQQGGFSFPSGHSMNGIFCYGMIIFLLRRYCKDRRSANILTAVLGVLIVCIGFSRVYVGVHYPTDVIGGLSLGLACLMAVTLGIDIVTHKKRIMKK